MRDDSDTTPEPAEHAPGEEHLPDQTEARAKHLPNQEIESSTEQAPDPDAIPELSADADMNERIRQANVIMRQIARLYMQKETGSYIAFTADLEIIIRVRALKERIGGDDFIQAAHDCGVGKNAAYDIIRLGLADKIDDIKQGAELAKRKAEAKAIPYKYPDIKSIIKEYKPPIPPKDKQSNGGEDVADANEDNAHDGDSGRSNRSVKEVRRENLALSEANRLLAQKLSKAEQEAKEAREESDRQIARVRLDREIAERRVQKAELRAIAAETRLAEVLAANNNHDADPPDDPPPSFMMAVDDQEDVGEPLLPPVVRDDPPPSNTSSPKDESVPLSETIIPQEPEPRTPSPVPADPIEPTAIDPNAGFEVLNEHKCLDYFGIPCTAPPHLIPQILAVRPVLEQTVGSRDIGAWIKAGYAKSLNDQTLFNIAKIREVVDDAKAQVAQAEADGFKIAEPAEYGAENHREAHDLMLKAFGLQGVVDGLKPLLDAGYLRIIGGMRLYRVEEMRALMETGRAAQKPPNPVPPYQIDPPRADPRKQIIGKVTLTQTEKDMIKDRWELKGLAGRVDPQRRTLALDNRCRTYHLIEMAGDDGFMDEAHRVLRGQKLRFWEQVGDCTVDAALSIVKRSE